MLEPRQYYRIHNMVRAVTSRVQRQGATTRHKAALWVLGRRVLPKVPLMLSPKEYEENKTVLIAKVATGEISITRPDNVRIDSLNDGTLIYYPPHKPATLKEPPLGLVEQIEQSQQEGDLEGFPGATGATGPSGCPTGPLGEPGPVGDPDLLVETPGPAALEEAEAVPVPTSEKITAELLIPDEEGPRLCTKCHELPAMEGTSLCIICVQPMKDPEVVPEVASVEEVPPVQGDVPPEPEAAPEVAPEVAPAEPVVEPAAEPERKPKKKGKKNHE